MGTPAFLLVVGFAMWVYEIIQIDYIWTKKILRLIKCWSEHFLFCRSLQYLIPSLCHMYLIFINIIISSSMQGVPSTRSRCPGQSWTSRKTKVLWMRHWRLCHRRWSWRWESLQGRSSSLLCWRWRWQGVQKMWYCTRDSSRMRWHNWQDRGAPHCVLLPCEMLHHEKFLIFCK